MLQRLLLFAASALLLVAAACSADDDDAAEAVDLEDAAPLEVTVQGGVDHVLVQDAEPGTELGLVDAEGRPVTAWFTPLGNQSETGTVDEEGLLGFGRLAPGEGYRVVSGEGGEGDDLRASEPVEVLDPEDHPPASFFGDQELVEGINYIRSEEHTS